MVFRWIFFRCEAVAKLRETSKAFERGSPGRMRAAFARLVTVNIEAPGNEKWKARRVLVWVLL